MLEKPVAGFGKLSFITLATLGYGDITPTAPEVMTLSQVEALIGRLNVAMLVSFHSSRQARNKKSSNHTKEQ